MRKSPEEVIRQKLILHLQKDLHYPKQQIIIEKELSTLCHVLKNNMNKLPKRRPDLVVVTPMRYTDTQNQHYSFDRPHILLLVECKVLSHHTPTIPQLCGYNYFIQAPCIAFVNQKELISGLYNPYTNTFQFIKGIPQYADLMSYYLNLMNGHL